MKKIIIFILISLSLAPPILAAENLTQKLLGYILLQAEQNGEAWYLNPQDQKRYFLARPQNAFDLMRTFGIGINDADLEKIPVGLIDYEDQDWDKDGLSNRLEEALGTDPNLIDTDQDGFDDKMEIVNNHNPLNKELITIPSDFTTNKTGKIFLAVERHGEAWYVNPRDQKRYYLGRPADAFAVMRQLSLGISNQDINKITIGQINEVENTCAVCQINNKVGGDNTETEVIDKVASAIRGNKLETAKDYFIPNYHIALATTMNTLSAEGRLILGNILSGAKLQTFTDELKTYKNEVDWQDEKIPVYFYVQKQEDGEWLMLGL